MMPDGHMDSRADYHIAEIDQRDPSQFDQYMAILVETYTPLDFLRPSVLPKEETRCYGIWHEGALEGIFGLTPLPFGNDAVFRELIDDVQRMPHARLIEISNVVLQKKIRGDVALGAMLYFAAKTAHTDGFNFLVGITRYQTLRYFVNFGVIPVLHDPLHLMNKSSVDDYVIYFDTHSKDSVFYMHERARRYFQQETIMEKIKSRYLENRRSPQHIATKQDSSHASL